MKQLIALVFLFGFGPALQAKSIWLQCGEYQFNLDSVRERYSWSGKSISFKNDGEKVFQGPAMFSPGQIDFSIENRAVGMGNKLKVQIDRKSLGYTVTMSFDAGFGGGYKVLNPSTGIKVGVCEIMKVPPTEGNQI